MARKRPRRGFGSTDQLASGRWRARYTGPDGVRHTSPTTYAEEDSALAWLRQERRLTEEPDTWVPPAERVDTEAPTLAGYVPRFLDRDSLSPVSRDNYATMLRLYALDTLGYLRLDQIDRRRIQRWYEELPADKPTTRARAYQVLRTLFNDAIARDEISGPNPCQIRGAGRVERASVTTIATYAEVNAAAAAMPANRRLMVPLAAYCALRLGEVAALRRQDIDLNKRLVKIRHSVAITRDGRGAILKEPKTKAGIRDVPIPPDLVPVIAAHLLEHAQPGPNGLLFPAAHGGFLTSGALRDQWHAAREAAGRPDLRFHDLRHTGLTLAAQAGATTAELMALAGHSDHTSVAIYQHATPDRMTALAERMAAARESEA